MASNVGVAITANTEQMKTLSLALKRAPIKVHKAILAALRAEMKVVMADASARASFSSRITSSMKIVGSGLRIRGQAGAGSGWIAMPIENRGEGNILHPVFAKKGSARYADKASWSNKNSHPAFMAPALEAHREEVLQIIEDVVYAEILKSLKV